MFLEHISEFSYTPKIQGNYIVKDMVILTKPLSWVSEDITVIVPQGFEFNLASIPWWLKWAVSRLGRNQRASCLHDYLYGETDYPRAWADKQFKIAMSIDGVAGWRSYSMWLGVRVGGWLYR
jgi:hypothetical protein